MSYWWSSSFQFLVQFFYYISQPWFCIYKHISPTYFNRFYSGKLLVGTSASRLPDRIKYHWTSLTHLLAKDIEAITCNPLHITHPAETWVRTGLLNPTWSNNSFSHSRFPRIDLRWWWVWAFLTRGQHHQVREAPGSAQSVHYEQYSTCEGNLNTSGSI